MQAGDRPIIELAEDSAKERWPRTDVRSIRTVTAQRCGSPASGGELADLGETEKTAAADKLGPCASWPSQLSKAPGTGERPSAAVRQLEADVVRNAELDTGKRIDGRDTKTFVRSWSRSACCRARTARRCSPAAKPRRCASVTLGTSPGRADRRRARGRVPRALHAALQLPPYSVGEAGRMGPRPSRNRPRRPGQRALSPLMPSGRPVPVHGPRRLRDPGVQRLRRRWRAVCGGSLALMDAGVPHGRGRWPASPWA